MTPPAMDDGTARGASEWLAAAYAEDCREHAAVPPVGTPDYEALRERDRLRRRDADIALDTVRRSGDPSADNLFHAAWLFNHGDHPDEARRSHELACEAAARGHPGARWLAAAALDRWCMYEGRPQKYGTQFVPDGRRYRLWDVDPATSDEERAAWDVPRLAEQLKRAEEMSRSEPQPPMIAAPKWLTDAIRRWAETDPEANG